VNPEAKTTPEQVAALQNEMRKTYLQVVGGAFAFVALVFGYRRVRVAEQGHITDRYTKAIEQLGALNAKSEPNVEVRLGAIYALERIAFDSPRDHWPIMEVLTAYVRQNAPAPAQIEQGTEAESKKPEKKIAKEPATVIQAILTVLGRRKRDHRREDKNRRLDLSYSDLDGARFVGAHLVATSFEGANLDRAQFFSTTLTNVYFRNAHLTNVDFSNATIRTSFGEAHLDGADFRGALGLTVAQFAYAKGVEQAQFDDAFRRKLKVAKEAANKSAVGNDDTPQT